MYKPLGTVLSIARFDGCVSYFQIGGDCLAWAQYDFVTPISGSKKKSAVMCKI